VVFLQPSLAMLVFIFVLRKKASCCVVEIFTEGGLKDPFCSTSKETTKKRQESLFYIYIKIYNVVLCAHSGRRRKKSLHFLLTQRGKGRRK
jgi:hypothetical protein